MLELSPAEMIKRISKGTPFTATTVSGSFSVYIQDYIPYVCTAIHNGNNLRDSLDKDCLLSDIERRYEEDAFTGDMLLSLPMVIICNDSRYEYDLNRSPDECVKETVFDRKIWDRKLSQTEINKSKHKHSQFYEVLEALLNKIVTIFDSCLVYDIHSYNPDKINRESPLFNIGTHWIDKSVNGKYVEHWKNQLSKIRLPNITPGAAVDDVFFGKGYFAEFISRKFKRVLVLPTEIKKVYCDPKTSTIYPLVFDRLKVSWKKSIVENAMFFCNKETNLIITKKNQLLSFDLDKSIIKLDKALYKIVRRFDLLSNITPQNVEHEKQKYFKSGFKKAPNFRYRQLTINPFEIKGKLYQLPVHSINDINIYNLYKDSIKLFALHCDLLSSIGSKKFFYHSLLCFGEPSENDKSNARFLLHCPSQPTQGDEKKFDAEQAVDYFKQHINQFGFECKVAISNKMVARALVVPSQRKLLIRKSAIYTEKELQALLYHEIGVHMMTTMNAEKQPLKLFRSGLPNNTQTQEGLAIYCEYVSGNLTIDRLKELALRVIAVSLMIKGYDFKQIFSCLHEDYDLSLDKAFYLTTRVVRGGGLTKDYLYLRGLREILSKLNKSEDIKNLFIGKTDIGYLGIINEMVEREMLLPPYYIPKHIENPDTNDVVLNYVTGGLIKT
ncbi:MAG: flavohemoglobin expression-modulating QEGLA motif protein [Deltaproteobacteria bacterium]|nr:flavohemoglobin expression-modulating QEGLA motif protein [Deltaproteobacteria bacterium]